jgi:FtsH-binding integral membrane protein
MRSPTLHIVSTVFGAFLFSLFIIYDTHAIMKKVSPEDYIAAVVRLYLDIINLFIEILKLLRHLQQDRQKERGDKKRSAN